MPRFCVLIAAVSIASPAHACTLCHSRAAEVVRAVVLGADFWPNLAALFAPVPILFAVVAMLRRALP